MENLWELFTSFLLSQVSYCQHLFWASGTAFTSPSLFHLPHCSFSSLTCSRAGGHPLCLRCLTMEMWRPKLRWTEQHSSQIRTPRLMLVQPGSDRQAERSGGIRSLINMQSAMVSLPNIAKRITMTVNLVKGTVWLF